MSTASTTPALFGGGLLRFVVYGVTHYYLHHGQPSMDVHRNSPLYSQRMASDYSPAGLQKAKSLLLPVVPWTYLLSSFFCMVINVKYLSSSFCMLFASEHNGWSLLDLVTFWLGLVPFKTSLQSSEFKLKALEWLLLYGMLCLEPCFHQKLPLFVYNLCYECAIW